MSKKFLVSTVAMFILSMALGFVVHGVLLMPEYSQLPALFRTQQDQASHLPFMLLAHLLLAAGFAWIYIQGKEDKPFLPQGARFGVAIAVLTTIPNYLIYYAIQPMPSGLVFQQIAFDTLSFIGMGIVVAWINR
jgi:hypothetical protein